MKKRLRDLERNRKHGDIYAKPPKKERKVKISNKNLYDITLSNFQFHIYELVMMINGIDSSYYLYQTENAVTLNANVKIDKTFKQLSKLDWDEPMDIDSLTFRGRFATLLLLQIVASSHKIVKNLYAKVDSGKKYKGYFYILDEWITRVDMFVTTYLTNNLNYRDHLEAILEVLLAAEDEDPEILKRLKETKTFLINACKGREKYTDGIICNNIMKMSYVLATNSMKVKRTPKYQENIDYRDQEMMVRQIGELGLAILKRRDKEDTPIIYKVFTKANPKIWSRVQYAEEYPEILIGMRALEMLKIFIDDKSVTKYINQIQRNLI